MTTKTCEDDKCDVGELGGWWELAANKVREDEAALKVREEAAAKKRAFDEKVAERETMRKKELERMRRAKLAMDERKMQEVEKIQEDLRATQLEYMEKKEREEKKFN